MKSMWKYVFCAMLIVMLSVSVAKAEENVLKTDLGTKGTIIVGLVDMQAGTYYDAKNKRILGGFQVSVVDFKGLISIDGGFVTDGHSNPPVFGLGLDILAFAKLLNLNYNLPDNLHLGAYVARDFNKSYDDGGFWGYSLNIQF